MEALVIDIKTILRITKDLRNNLHVECVQRLTQDVQSSSESRLSKT
jgi:hypothetical protein